MSRQSQSVSSDAKELFEKGKDALELENYDSAIEFFTKAIEKRPNDSEIYEYRCDAYLKQELYKLALNDANEIIKLAPREWYGYSCQVSALLNLDRHEDAQATLDSASESKDLTDNDKSIIWTDVGGDFQKMGDHTSAIELFNKAIKWDSSYSNCYLSRCRSQFEMGQYEEALEDAKRARCYSVFVLDEVPSYKAKCLAMLGRFEDAIAASESIESYSKEEAPRTKAFIYNAQADIVLGNYDYDEAIHLYTNAIQHHRDPKYFLNRGNAYAHKQQWSFALEDAEEYICDEPSDRAACAQAWYLKGQALYELGKYQESIYAYDESLKIEETSQAKEGKEFVQRRLQSTVISDDRQDFNALGDGLQKSSNDNQSRSDLVLVNVTFKNTTRSRVKVKVVENNNFDNPEYDFCIRSNTIVQYPLDVTKIWNVALECGRFDDTCFPLHVTSSNMTIDVASYLN